LIRLSEGETWELDATFYEADGVTLLGSPIAAINWYLGNTAGADTVALHTTIGTGWQVVDVPGRRAKMTLAPAAHDDVGPGIYAHQCYVTCEDGRVSKQFEGTIEVTDSLAVAAT